MIEGVFFFFCMLPLFLLFCPLMGEFESRKQASVLKDFDLFLHGSMSFGSLLGDFSGNLGK